MSGVKQLMLFKFVKLKTTGKRAKVATPDDTENSCSHTAAATELESSEELSQLTTVKGESCSIDDEDIYTALVETSKSPSPCSTPVMVCSSQEETMLARFSPDNDGDDYRVQCMTQSRHTISMDCSTSSMGTISTSPSSDINLLEPCTPISATNQSTSIQLSDGDEQLNEPQSNCCKANNSAFNSSANGSTTSVSSTLSQGFISTCTSSTLEPSTTDAGLPKDITQSLSFPPAQPVKAKYPSTMFSKVPRCFNAVWYKQFNWLEYSIERDVCYCYPCRLFGSMSVMGRSRPEQTFTLTGFKSWKHATGKKGILVGLLNSISHKESMQGTV